MPKGFVTRDSGKRQEFNTGMQRDTQDGKPRFDLTIPEKMPYDKLLLTRWAELMGRGASKYTVRNWETACTKTELDRFKSSAFRHFMQWYNDVEDGEDHAAAVLFNINGAEYTKWRMEQKKNGQSIVDIIEDERTEEQV